MIINKINLDSFGQFEFKEVTFAKGLNIVYGLNERGKSTIHTFIEGVFYGFYEPYLKRRVYTSAYYKYLPWSHPEDYRGSIHYEIDGKNFQVMRDFIRESKGVKVFDETGKDVTEEFEYDPVFEVHQPALKHIKLNKTTFNNTVSIRQLGSKTSEEIISEIEKSLSNIKKSNDERISVDDALNILSSRISEQDATHDVYTMNQIQKRIEDLENEKQMVVDTYKRVKAIQSDTLELRRETSKVDSDLEVINNKLLAIKKEIYEKKLKDSEEVNTEITEIKKNMSGIAKFENIQDSDVSVVVDEAQQLKVYQETVTQLENEVREIAGEIARVQALIDESEIGKKIKEQDSEKISIDFQMYNNLKDKVAKINDEINQLEKEDMLTSRDENRKNDFEKDYYKFLNLTEWVKSFSGDSEDTEELVNEIRKVKMFGNILMSLNMVSIAGLIALVVLNWVYDTERTLVIMFGAVVIVEILMLVAYNFVNKEQITHQKDLKYKEKRNREEKERIVSLENNIKAILSKYDVETKEDFLKIKEEKFESMENNVNTKQRIKILRREKEMVDKEIRDREDRINLWTTILLNKNDVSVDSIYKIREKFDQYKEFNDKKVFLQKIHASKDAEYVIANKKVEAIKQIINEILTKYSVISIQKLIEAKEGKDEFLKLKERLEGRNKVLESILEGLTFEELKEKYEIIKNAQAVVEETEEELLLSMKELSTRSFELQKRIETSEEQMLSEISDLKPMIEIESSLSALLHQKEEKAHKIEVYNDLKVIIERLVSEIENSLSPELNKKVSTFIKNVTDKYHAIKVNNNMEIFVKDPTSNDYVSADKLSLGTVDQIYFGLRLGIADLIQKNCKLPLILDDSFIQYDDERLERVLRALAASDRQIIILTCQRREKETLDRIDLDYNYIAL